MSSVIDLRGKNIQILAVLGTGGVMLPSSTTANRPSGLGFNNPVIRWNTDTSKLEVWSNNHWDSIPTDGLLDGRYVNQDGDLMTGNLDMLENVIQTAYLDPTNKNGNNLKIQGTGGLTLPVGNSTNRPVNEIGTIRFSTFSSETNQSNVVEVYNGTAWDVLATTNAGGFVNKTGDTMLGAFYTADDPSVPVEETVFQNTWSTWYKPADFAALPPSYFKTGLTGFDSYSNPDDMPSSYRAGFTMMNNANRGVQLSIQWDHDNVSRIPGTGLGEGKVSIRVKDDTSPLWSLHRFLSWDDEVIHKSGSISTGPQLTTSASVTSPASNEFITKSYADNNYAGTNAVLKTGSISTGPQLTTSPSLSSPASNEFITKAYADATYAGGSSGTGVVLLIGSESTGPQTSSSTTITNPAANEFVVKSYVENNFADKGFVENLMPPGAIIMWSPTAGAIPNGWAACDGTNGTPDLRGKFIVAATNDLIPGTTSSETISSTGTINGSSDPHVLTESEIPSHYHYMVNTVYGGDGSTHEVTSPGNQEKTINWGAGSGDSEYRLSATGSNPATIGRSGNTGGGQGHSHDFNITVPYYALIYIMRVS